MRWEPLNATTEERNTFDTGHESMKMGWTGTMDQLAEYLARARNTRQIASPASR